jgi:CelD/BcsL family acetyltransferase involved in cellulose biosynthesis
MDRQDTGHLERRAQPIARSATEHVGDGSLTAETVEHESDLIALRDDWDRLYAEAGYGAGDTFNPFASWTWMWQWWSSRSTSPLLAQPRYRLRIGVFRDRDGVVRMITPFVRARWGFGPIALHATRLFGFGPCTSDLRAPIVWPGWERAAADVLADALRDPRGGQDLAILDGIPEYGAFTQRLVAHSAAAGWSWGPSVPTHVLALPDDWDAFRRGLKGHLKKSVRHGYNSLARDGIAWTFELETDPARLDAALDDLFRLHALRADPRLRPRHVDYYARSRDRAMMRGVARAQARDRSFGVARLRIDGQVVAARIIFLGGGGMYLHDAGADPAWSRYAVATTLTAECLRWGIAARMRWVNLGTGDDPSKSRWAGQVRMLRRMDAVAPTLAGRVLALAQRLPTITRWVSFGAMPLLGDLPIDTLA